jgi:GTPase SAR1 family protein
MLMLIACQQTQSSDRARGLHDVRQELTWEGRPDLIVHDSGGFEAGTENEFHAIEDFLKARSAVHDIMEQVHVVWFCIDITSSRTLQTATEKLFSAISRHAKDVPIVVVATKKDELLDVSLRTRQIYSLGLQDSRLSLAHGVKCFERKGKLSTWQYANAMQRSKSASG